jgi:ketosteroid isomerase-like protein
LSTVTKNTQAVAENVELVRSMHPGPGFDLAPLINDDQATDWWSELLAQRFDSAVRGTMRLPGLEPQSYLGLEGLRDAWRAWLEHWKSYHDEIEEVIDGGERVVVVHLCRGRPAAGEPEVAHRSATVWTIREGRVALVDFNVPCSEALIGVEVGG